MAFAKLDLQFAKLGMDFAKFDVCFAKSGMATTIKNQIWLLLGKLGQ
jgi:hypothetical protein